MIKYFNIGCFYNKKSKKARFAFKELSANYDLHNIHFNQLVKCSFIITLGGDGEVLRALHIIKNFNIPIYGMNRGSLGFLLNKYNPINLVQRIKNSKNIILYPLKVIIIKKNYQVISAHAFNEVSLLRASNQISKIRIVIDGAIRMNALYTDGVIVSTPIGSTAYNFAAHGSIIPINANILALTPINPFRPRGWKGALISNKSNIKFQIIECSKRPVSAVVDSQEIKGIRSVEIFLDLNIKKKILFDKNNSLQDKVFKEQFYRDKIDY